MLRALAIAVGLASAALAQVAKFCPSGESGAICYRVNVPDTTASSGNGDIFFQILGPSSKQWIALGQGHGMMGTNIFIIYADPSGKNVTLSPRLGKGYYQPRHDQDAQVSLLEGSGIQNGQMVANVRCSNCLKWQGGSMDIASTSSPWVWATKGGAALRSDDPDADISQHDSNGEFTFDLTEAKGGNSLNPFVETKAASPSAASGGSSPSGPASSSPSENGNDSNPGNSGNSEAGSSSNSPSYSSGSEEGSDSGSSETKPSSTRRNALIAHGVLMSLTFVIFFPLGAILLRTLALDNLISLHGRFQAFAYVVALAGMGLGIYIAVRPTYLINKYHPVIGLVVIGLLTIQPVLGTLQHKVWRQEGRRSVWGLAHAGLGRVVLTLAIINGGLGFRLAGNTRGGEIAYGVVAGLVWVVWMAVASRAEVKKAREGPRGAVGGKKVGNGSPEGSAERA
ncbi:MAG: hypothetical protein Q9167_002454 [Letrouitia subvulpina]